MELHVTRTRHGIAAAVVLVLMGAGLLASGTWAALTGRLDMGVELLTAGVALGGLALLFVQMRRAPHVEMHVNTDELLARFGGLDTLWTLRREVRVPLRHVAVRQIGALSPRWGWRRRGTDIGGLIRAGSFATRGAPELWDAREGAVAVDMELVEPAPFRRLVLEVADPSAAAAQLRGSSSG